MPPVDINELDKRLVVAENDLKHMAAATEELKSTVNENYRLTLEIKERLDKQNGSIPHMSKGVESISSNLILLSKRMNDSEKRNISNTFKTKLMWGALIFITSALVTATIGYFVSSR